MIKEVWKPVKDFNGFYEVSNTGLVRSVSRIDSNNHLVKGVILKPFVDKWGYEIVGLHKDGIRLTRRVHRLVAEAFLPNPKNYPQINHINRNKNDNSVNNLEWCTNLYNQHYDRTYAKANRATSIPVVAIKDNHIVYVFSSANEAARYFNAKEGSLIMRCIKHEDGYKTAYGYCWDRLPIANDIFRRTYERCD